MPMIKINAKTRYVLFIPPLSFILSNYCVRYAKTWVIEKVIKIYLKKVKRQILTNKWTFLGGSLNRKAFK
jgi:hypothetical protein